ncbi:MAG: polysaccharide pyruvyl transferase CsaB [Halanaerobiales bacterium]
MHKLLISGYYGFDNNGDEAILMSIIAALKCMNEGIKITALSANPRVTADRYNIESVNRNKFSSIIKEIKKSDLFVSGGGSLLQDVTGWKSVPYYLGQVLLAQMMGKKTVFYAQGIGPVKNKAYRWLIKKVMGRADYISVRDKQSKRLLADWGVEEEKIKLAVDPVFVLRNIAEDYTNSKEKDDTARGRNNEQIIKRDNGLENTDERPLIGVSVRPWRGSIYLKNFATALSKFASTINADLAIIPFHLEEDQQISNRLKDMVLSEWEDSGYQAYIEICEADNPIKIMNIYEELDFLLGVRLHSLIFAVVKNVPFVAVEYDPKVAGFLQMIGINSSVEIEDLDTGELNRICQSIWSNRKKFASILKQQGILLGRIALENALELKKLI